MTFLKYIFSPKLFKEYGTGTPQQFYESSGLEKWGDQIIYTLSLMWNISYYTSPLIITFLYRRGYFVAESIASMAKISTGIGILVVISLCMRGIGRSQSKVYTRFAKALENAKANNVTAEAKNQLRLFDFDFNEWPVDFVAPESRVRSNSSTKRTNSLWISSLPCEIAAYIAIHTFGVRMIYPGSLKIIQSYLQPVLLEGRATLIEEHHGSRYKLQTGNNNYVDTVFVDNRQNGDNGKTLVICSEGNAGFYEIGLMTTPLALNYSVLGWNHPGFGGSTGSPYPENEQAAVDAVVQFAIDRLGFVPENILLYGWSIGGYATVWAASRYPDVKGVILDASFDDILYLAQPRMPLRLSGIVKIAIRQYMNLHNSELMNHYNGPVLLIRRTKDEVISENMDISTNRGNFLLINMLKARFPNIMKPEQIVYVTNLLNSPLDNSLDNSTEQLCSSLLLSFVSEHGRLYPVDIGAEYTQEQRNQMAKYLVHKHLIDFKSSHCTPLPADFFQMPWTFPDDESDFVIT